MSSTATMQEEELAIENFAAELAEAAFPIILQQRPRGSWLDLELDLWKVLSQTVKHSVI